MHLCTKCKALKPVADFASNKTTKTGLHCYCRSCVRDYNRVWQGKRSLEEKAAQQRLWREKNQERNREHIRRSSAKKLSTPRGRVINAFRARIYQVIRQGSKRGGKTFAILGYTPDQLMRHLERQFSGGMSWENYGEWHVDHIVPLSAFNFSGADDYDFKRAWDLKNLQPLWSGDNLRKHAKLSAPFQPSLI